jgi:hypothetical protein
VGDGAGMRDGVPPRSNRQVCPLHLRSKPSASSPPGVEDFVVLRRLNGFVGDICSLPIYESSGPPPPKLVSAGEGSHSSHVGSVEPDHSVVGNAMAGGGGDRLDAATQVSLGIQESYGRPPWKMLSAGEGSLSSHAGSVEADQSVVGIVMAAGGGARQDAAAQVDTATSPAKSDPNSPRSTQPHRPRSMMSEGPACTA